MVSIRKRNSKTSYGLFWFLNFPHATRNFHAPTHFQLAHAQTNFPAVALRCVRIFPGVNSRAELVTLA